MQHWASLLLLFVIWIVGDIVALGFFIGENRTDVSLLTGQPYIGPRDVIFDFKNKENIYIFITVCVASWLWIFAYIPYFFKGRLSWRDWSLKNGPSKKERMLWILED